MTTAEAPLDAQVAQALEALLRLVTSQADAAHIDGSFVATVGPLVTQDGYDAKSAETMMRAALRPGRDRLLDFGCGAGGYRPMLESLGWRWRGVDYLDAVAAGAQARVAAQPDISFYDGKLLPFADDSFDGVWSFLTFEHIQHIDVTFGELARVMAPGAELVGQVAYLEQMHDYSTFNFTPYGLKVAAERNGLKLLEVHPKHDAFAFLFRRLYIIFGGRDDNSLGRMFDPTGPFHRIVQETGERLGLSPDRINLLRLMFCTHFTFRIVKPEPNVGLEPESDARTRVGAGIRARDAGQTEAAETTFRDVLQRAPENASARYELAFTLMIDGRHEEAVALIDQAPTDDPRSRALAARMLYADGQRARADAHMAGVTTANSGLSALQIEGMKSFGAWTEANPKAEMLAASRHAETAFIDAGAIAALAEERLEAGEGFSLIRLGDGEGAFFPVPAPGEERFAALHALNREDRARVWFDGTLDLDASGFTATAQDVVRASAEADVLGLPYLSWIEHEYRIASPTGISALGDIIRWYGTGAAKGRVCRQTTHMELHRSGALDRLLRRADRLGVIACHPDLPDRLRTAYGVDEVEFHKLPGEKLMRAKIGDAAASGVHYPDVFERTMAALDRPQNHRLWLVAGGILGKLYCDRIRARGGVALDIGSLADAWVGANTRPGYSDQPALPAAA